MRPPWAMLNSSLVMCGVETMKICARCWASPSDAERGGAIEVAHLPEGWKWNITPMYTAITGYTLRACGGTYARLERTKGISASSPCLQLYSLDGTNRSKKARSVLSEANAVVRLLLRRHREPILGNLSALLSSDIKPPTQNDLDIAQTDKLFDIHLCQSRSRFWLHGFH